MKENRCVICGKPIRRGIFCIDCVRKEQQRKQQKQFFGMPVKPIKDEQELSGIETWHFIAPILAMHGGTLGDKLDLFDKAYVKIYSALKYWDEHHKDNKGDKK
jgi:hypothetical protein